MSTPRVLVVDDEVDIRKLIEITLARMGVDTDAAENVERARERLASAHFDLCLTDMRMPDGTGTDLVRHIQSNHPDVPVAVITAYGNTDDAVECMKLGAFDFVSKPVDIHMLRKLVESALSLGRTPPAPDSPPRQTALVGDTVGIRQLRKTIDKLGRSQAPVYITGESGTGKELVAREIHAQGTRRDGPFVPVNCGAIPGELMESELFGHLRGSFTGANQDKEGLFQAADGGTLFLDEVADLPLHMQVKLLRAIQERAVRPVGAKAEVAVDVRIVSATHHDLAERVREGVFRQDLFYRLNVIQVTVPPLRERAADIPLLAQRLLSGIAQRYGLEQPPALTPDAIAQLQAHSFPGNVRELDNVLERAVALADSSQITASDLQVDPAPPAAIETGGDDADGLRGELEDIERQRIMEALQATRFNKTKAAERLGMSFRQLRYRTKKLGID
ncbi:MAG: sigma-54 dependent transcriptional regulator [Pseudomonadota bacterium]|nr:sigma-54 dependent transcriptional regulator [Pseudomonadota bacterium]